jgi:sulfur-carrier protein adenylyltransferase/sulfurtransferase
MTTFDYHSAFSRSLGWITSQEANALRTKRVAIAGLGGVGGSHLLTLTRFGIGAFNLSDLDVFDIENFNRQAGATLRSIGHPKLEVMADMALEINPELRINRYPVGIDTGNLDSFLASVDLYVDSLDFFAITIRRAVFARCAELKIPAITAAPLGMGVSFLAFMPGKMTFEEYFRMEGRCEEEQLLRFLIGLSPRGLQARYLVDRSRLDLKRRKGPSTPVGVDLCAGVAGANALKILLGRGEIVHAPAALHFDAYRNRFIKTWRPGGNANPLHRILLAVARRRLGIPSVGAHVERT